MLSLSLLVPEMDFMTRISPSPLVVITFFLVVDRECILIFNLISQFKTLSFFLSDLMRRVQGVENVVLVIFSEPRLPHCVYTVHLVRTFS